MNRHKALPHSLFYLISDQSGKDVYYFKWNIESNDYQHCFSQGFTDGYIKRSYFRFEQSLLRLPFLQEPLEIDFIGFYKTVGLTGFAINDTMIFLPRCFLFR